MLGFYWELGSDIVEKQKNAKWGSGFLPQLSQDLTTEFSEIKRFSETNLKYTRKWYVFYSESDIKSQQLADQLNSQAVFPKNPMSPLFQIPW